MKIKVKVSKDQRKWIEGQEKNYRLALKDEKKRHIKEMADIQKRLDDYIKFWETNTKPIRDYSSSRKGGIGFYKTENVYYIDPNFININLREPTGEWVCKFCLRPRVEKDFSYSDSRYDTSVPVCDCEGAKKTGIPWEKIEFVR